MRVLKMILTIIYLSCLGILFILFGTQAAIYFQRRSLIQEPDAYLVYHEERTPRSRLHEDDWIANDQKIYVLLDEASQVNVYDLSGKFLYGIQFSHSRNGEAEIGMKNGQLIIKTRSNNYLVFEGEQKVEYYSINKKDCEEIKEALQCFKSQKNNQDRAIIQKGNKLYRINELNNQECIIAIPCSLRTPIILSVMLLSLVYCLARVFIMQKKASGE